MSTVFMSIKKNIDSLISGLAGFIIICLFTKHSGIGISPDSIVYTSVARNIQHGVGLVDYSGRPMVDFPAMYAIFLFGISFITRLDVIAFAPVLNGLLFAAVIYTSGCIMEQFINRSKWYKWILLACITISPSLIEIYAMLWSETLFIFLLLLFFIAFKNYFKYHSGTSLLFISLVTAFAFVTRYAGITFIAVGGLLILLDRNIDWIKKVIHILLFGTIGISLALINFIRNLLSAGMLTGVRQKGITPFDKNLEYYGAVLHGWLGFQTTNHSPSLWTGIAVLLFFSIIFLWQVIQYYHYDSYENIAVVFFIIYASFIVLSSTLSRYETINSRLLAPAFIPFIWGLTYYIPKWIKTKNNSMIKCVMIICCFAVAIFFLRSQWLIDDENYSYMKDSGIPGYTEDDWTQSAIVKFIQKDSSVFKSGHNIYSNQNHAIYFYTGYQTQTVPEAVHEEEVKDFFANNNSYLIWFNNDPNTDLLSLSEIREKKKLTPVHSFIDGAVYLCTNDSSAIKQVP